MSRKHHKHHPTEEEHEDPMKYAYRRVIHGVGQYEPVKYYDPVSNYYNLLNVNKIPIVKTTDKLLNWEDIFYKKERTESMNRHKELEVLKDMEARGELDDDPKVDKNKNINKHKNKKTDKMDYIDTSNSNLNTNCWYNTMFNNNIIFNSSKNAS